MPFIYIIRLKIITFILLSIGNYGFTQIQTEQYQSSSQRMPNSDVELVFCDEDNDGHITFNVETLKEQILQVTGIENDYYLERILVSTSAESIVAIDNPSTNPYITQICPGPYASFDVAVDADQKIYTTRLLRILNDCNTFVYSTGNFWQANALSFDDLNQLYVGFGTESHVYRYANLSDGSTGSSALWHDFVQGTAGGDFVLFNENMYVAWRLGSGNYRLYEVTVDENRNYMSHIDLGQLPNETYGLAKEYGKIYGITPTTLYQINLENFTFTDVFVNPNPDIEWYGAAGLHEAVNFNTSLHTTLNDAQTNTNILTGEWTNTVSGGQIIFLRIENTLTGTFDIVNVLLSIYDYPVVNPPINLEKCFNDNYNSFDLNEVTNQMLIDDNQNLEFTYYISDPETDNFATPQSLTFQTNTISQLLFVKVVNLDGGCYEVYEFKLINNEVPNVVPLSTPQMPTELTVCYLDNSTNGYFDLTDIEDDIILENDDFNVSYHLSFEDAEAGINLISNIYVLQVPVQEIFIKVTDENGCYSISNFYLNQDCIRDNPSTAFIIFPRFMTPNNDTKNDYWNVKGISERLMNESTITIFDRYGKVLISFKPSSTVGWDGTVNGVLMPTSDYWVVFKTNSGFTKTGHFTLKR